MKTSLTIDYENGPETMNTMNATQNKEMRSSIEQFSDIVSKQNMINHPVSISKSEVQKG